MPLDIYNTLALNDECRTLAGHIRASNTEGIRRAVSAILRLNGRLDRRLDHTGMTALHLAISIQSLESFFVLRDVIQKQPDCLDIVNTVDYQGVTPLQLALRKKSIIKIHTLIELGADLALIDTHHHQGTSHLFNLPREMQAEIFFKLSFDKRDELLNAHRLAMRKFPRDTVIAKTYLDLSGLHSLAARALACLEFENNHLPPLFNNTALNTMVFDGSQGSMLDKAAKIHSLLFRKPKTKSTYALIIENTNTINGITKDIEILTNEIESQFNYRFYLWAAASIISMAIMTASLLVIREIDFKNTDEDANNYEATDILLLASTIVGLLGSILSGIMAGFNLGSHQTFDLTPAWSGILHRIQNSVIKPLQETASNAAPDSQLPVWSDFVTNVYIRDIEDHCKRLSRPTSKKNIHRFFARLRIDLDYVKERIIINKAPFITSEEKSDEVVIDMESDNDFPSDEEGQEMTSLLQP